MSKQGSYPFRIGKKNDRICTYPLHGWIAQAKGMEDWFFVPSGKPSGVKQSFKIGIQVGEDYNVETCPEMIPEVPLTAELFP